LQVRVPDAITCWNENPEQVASNPCLTSTAGWWYGYGYGYGLYRNLPEVKLEGKWREVDHGIGIIDESSGTSLISSNGLEVKFTVQSSGDINDLAGAAIGFNFKQGNYQTEDIKQYGGYCITYSSDGEIRFVLTHDGNNYDDGCTFEFKLPTSTSPRAVSLGFDQFVKPSWCAGATRPKPQVEKSIALSEAMGIHLATEPTNSQTPLVIEFTLHQLGWLNGGCNTNLSW
jgi:hypothetical protein